MRSSIPNDWFFCKCGCGERTPLHRDSGIPITYIHGHNNRKKGKKVKRYVDGHRIYVSVIMNGKYRVVDEARYKAEKALGRPIPKKAKVHHADENTLNNSKGNLVLCENQAYHVYLHVRTRALKECGHANWLKCVYCKEYDDPKAIESNMFTTPGKARAYHRECHNDYNRRRNVQISNNGRLAY